MAPWTCGKRNENSHEKLYEYRHFSNENCLYTSQRTSNKLRIAAGVESKRRSCEYLFIYNQNRDIYATYFVCRQSSYVSKYKRLFTDAALFIWWWTSGVLMWLIPADESQLFNFQNFAGQLNHWYEISRIRNTPWKLANTINQGSPHPHPSTLVAKE